MKTSNSVDHHKGVIVPLVTPLTPDLQLDQSALRRLINHIIEGGVHGLFVLGTTGEGVSLDFETRCQTIEQSRAAVPGRVNLYVGISHACLTEVLRLERFCRERGVKTVVIHPPFFYTVGYEELDRYFERVLDAVTCKVMLYNIPHLTKMDIPIELIEKLSTHPQVIGLKDSSKDMDRLCTLIEMFAARKDFQMLAGVSAVSLWALRLGAAGFVPSVGNLCPAWWRELCDRHRRDETARADQLSERLLEINNIFQSGSDGLHPIARIKAGLEILGICSRQVAGPLLAATDEQLEQIRRKMKAAEIIC